LSAFQIRLDDIAHPWQQGVIVGVNEPFDRNPGRDLGAEIQVSLEQAGIE
jgi:hypothetical protein